MKTLKLFNAVLAKESKGKNPYVAANEGYIIEPGALYAQDRILAYYAKESLDGNDLNKTFHKSWDIIRKSTRGELAIAQILHYISGYGSKFTEELYIPEETINVPVKITFKVIKAYTKEELTEKCLNLLTSGIALTEETIKDVIDVLDNDLGYVFTGDEGIRNKEALVIIADRFGVYPKDVTEFFRYVIFKATGETLLIKNKELIYDISISTYNPTKVFEDYGLDKLATIFNRFKPLFLAFKKRPLGMSVINKISKLSKKHHTPMVSNPLNLVTSQLLTSEDEHWLENATPYSLFKALSACHDRSNGERDTFAYRIRNGKSYVEESALGDDKIKVAAKNFNTIAEFLKKKHNMEGVRVYLPNNISYALPTSEKMFVGNVPTGTKFYGKKLAVGIYWENSWGAHDLDLSALNIGGKIGWNASFVQGNGHLMYSGDMTYADDGAVEYMYANKGMQEPSLILNNVYGGDDTAGFKLIVGNGDNITKEYMMNPNNLLAEVKTNCVQRQNVLGIMIPEENSETFVLLNMGSGSARVSGNSEISELYTRALYQQWSRAFNFKSLLELLGAEIVDTNMDVDYDFSIDKIEKDTFVNFIESDSKLDKKVSRVMS